jgi:hypothetical protein
LYVCVCVGVYVGVYVVLRVRVCVVAGVVVRVVVGVPAVVFTSRRLLSTTLLRTVFARG